MVPSDKPRGNGQILKHIRLQMTIKIHFLTVRVTKHHHRFLGELVKSLLVERFKSHLNMDLSNNL